MEWTFSGEVASKPTHEEMICQAAMGMTEKNKAVGGGKQWEGFILGRWAGALHAETRVVCRGAQCDHPDETHSRPCGRKERGGLTSRKERGRTSAWLERRQGGTGGGRWGWRVGRDTDCVGTGVLFPSVTRSHGAFWAGEKHALKWEEWLAKEHGHQLKGCSLDIHWSGQTGLPDALDEEGEGRMVHRFLAWATRWVMVPPFTYTVKIEAGTVVRGALAHRVLLGLVKFEASILCPRTDRCLFKSGFQRMGWGWPGCCETLSCESLLLGSLDTIGAFNLLQWHLGI